MAVAEAAHVPAWKRLGLKLKNNQAANENAESPQAIQPTHSSDLKKRKATAVDASSPASHDKSLASRSRSEATEPPLKRKKSVAFADDTKTEDGDSNEKLLEDYVAQQNGGQNQFSKSEVAQFTAPSKVHPANEPVTKTNGATKEAKKEKKKKDRSRDAEAFESPRQELAYVTYLKQYHTSRSKWNFNKNHQTKLLHNVYNTYRVPFEVDEALTSYLAGLKGDAARSRLIEDAEKVITETKDLEGADTIMPGQDINAARERSLKAQLKQTKSNFRNQEAAASAYSEEHQEKLRKRKRAVLVLNSLKSYPSPRSEDDQTVANVQVEDQLPAAKRKRNRRKKSMRTGVPDDDDTDETSSVSSVPFTESSSEGEDGESASGSSGSESSQVSSEEDDSDSSSSGSDDSDSDGDSD